jgi:cyclopropane-fatty-acyl-phospholipid synthase
MALQSITIADRHYLRTRDEVDFIKRYIFPGACIPSVGALAAAAAASGGLQLVSLDDIGPHYATTLAEWRRNFFRNIDAVRALGYPETFIRMWEYYLCYCEAGFRERQLGDVQAVFIRQ